MPVNKMTETKEYYTQDRRDVALLIPAPQDKTLLDVGCGEGLFGSLMKSDFYAREIWGIEPVQRVADEAKKRLDRVIVGKLGTHLGDLPDSYFDVVIFNDSLEHMEDPWTVLEEITPKLSSGGVICASIPNVRWYRNLFNLIFRKDWKYTDQGVLDKTHLRFFTMKSMARLFHESGYEILEMNGIKYAGGNFWLIPKMTSLLTLMFFEDCFYKNYFIVAKPAPNMKP